MRKLPLLLLLTTLLLPLSAQVTVTATAPPVLPGKATTVTVALSGATQVSGVQWTLTPPANWTLGTQTLTAAVAAVPKSLACGAAGTGSLCFIWGLNVLPVPVGPLTTATVTVPASAVPGAFTVALTGTVAGDLAGVLVPSTGVSATVTVLSPFDINGDGQVTQSDVTAVVAQVQAQNCTSDPRGDGSCNVLTVIAEVRGWIAAGSKP